MKQTKKTVPPKDRRAYRTGCILERAKRSRFLYIRYYVDGRRITESAKTTSRALAEALLRKRLGDAERGELLPASKRVTFKKLMELVVCQRRLDGRKGTVLKDKHLQEAFGGWRAVAITATEIKRYEVARLAAGAKRATVNNELAILRRAFNLAREEGLLLPTQGPRKIRTPNPQNARTGFFEPDDFAALCHALPEEYRPAMRFGYLTGWRVRSEVLPLTWDRVDLKAGTVRLEPGTTKNREGRTFPFDVLPELAALLRAQRDATTAVEKATGRIVPWVFHRRGAPIRSYKDAWYYARERAAYEGEGALRVLARPRLLDALVHDLRRTAVRNLVRANVSEHTAMKLTGHKTRSVFDRYDIVDEADLRSAVEKLAKLA